MISTRYNIPIENISYEYIAQMDNTKETEQELEKIIKILQSGELGHFPDLLDKAREKLKEVNRNHRLVRSDPEPVKKLDGLDLEQVTAIRSELNDWCSQMKRKEAEAVANKPEPYKNGAYEVSSKSNVRDQHRLNTANSKINTDTKGRIKSCDYQAWDKFDPDVEIKKMDVAVEREKTRIKRNEVDKHPKNGQGKGGDEKEFFTIQEKVSYANVSREKGNNAYKAGKYQDAIKFYTESIQLYPTAIAYSNRAQVYIKLGDLKAAILDCDLALHIDAFYTKAIYRKALAFYNLKQYEEAIVWFEKFLREEPNNKTAHDYMVKLHNIVPLKLRLDGSKFNSGDCLTEKVTANIVAIKENVENSSPNKKTMGEDTATGSAQRNEWGLVKRPPLPEGQPEFMRQYESDAKNSKKPQANLSWNKCHVDRNHLTAKTTSDFPDRTTQNVTKIPSSDVKRKYNEFLDATEDYRPKSIIDIFGTNRMSIPDEDTKDSLSPHIEVMPSSKKEKAPHKPKIEILKSVNFEE